MGFGRFSGWQPAAPGVTIRQPGWWRFHRHRKLYIATALVAVMGVLGTVTKHPKPAAPPAQPGSTATTIKAKPVTPGYRTVNTDTSRLACGQVLAPGSYTDGLAALTLNANNGTRGTVYVWQFNGTKATFTTGVDWVLVVYWVAGTNVLGDSIAKPGAQLASPGPVTAAVAVPVGLIPYRVPSQITLGAPCAPSAAG